MASNLIRKFNNKLFLSCAGLSVLSNLALMPFFVKSDSFDSSHLLSVLLIIGIAAVNTEFRPEQAFYPITKNPMIYYLILSVLGLIYGPPLVLLAILAFFISMISLRLRFDSDKDPKFDNQIETFDQDFMSKTFLSFIRGNNHKFEVMVEKIEGKSFFKSRIGGDQNLSISYREVEYIQISFDPKIISQRSIKFFVRNQENFSAIKALAKLQFQIKNGYIFVPCAQVSRLSLNSLIETFRSLNLKDECNVSERNIVKFVQKLSYTSYALAVKLINLCPEKSRIDICNQILRLHRYGLPGFRKAAFYNIENPNFFDRFEGIYLENLETLSLYEKGEIHKILMKVEFHQIINHMVQTEKDKYFIYYLSTLSRMEREVNSNQILNIFKRLKQARSLGDKSEQADYYFLKILTNNITTAEYEFILHLIFTSNIKQFKRSIQFTTDWLKQLSASDRNQTILKLKKLQISEHPFQRILNGFIHMQVKKELSSLSGAVSAFDKIHIEGNLSLSEQEGGLSPILNQPD